MTCNCSICVREREWNEILSTGDVEKIKDLFDVVRNYLYQTEDDLNWAEAVIDGSWPNADGVIARRRCVTMANRKRNEAMSEAEPAKP